MRIAVLALQGAFLEHEMLLNKLGVDCFEVTTKGLATGKGWIDYPWWRKYDSGKAPPRTWIVGPYS